MEFVVHNTLRNITLRAAFTAAFFAPFFANADVHRAIAENAISVESPESIKFCEIVSVGSPALNPLIGHKTFGEVCNVDPVEACAYVVIEVPYAGSGTTTWYDNIGGEIQRTSDKAFKLQCTIDQHRWSNGNWITLTNYKSPINVGGAETNDIGCPPSSFPAFTYAVNQDDDSDPELCVDPLELQNYLDNLVSETDLDEYCKSLVLDSGNNSASSMCFTSPSGRSCNVEKVTTNYGGKDFTYYQGTSSKALGCVDPDVPRFDREGIGNENDSCFTSGDKNYCSANKDSHCSVVQGSEICDDGCLETADGFFCDAAIHPDVGEGDSNYFDDNGTCTVVAGSAYRGACEELGGTWEKGGDYTDTSCPETSVAGSCSVTTNGGCFSCLDAGGTWTPDENAPLTNTEKGIQDVANLSQEANDNLKILDTSVRKGNEALISTIKNTQQKLKGEVANGTSSIVSELKGIKEELKSEDKEKQSYTVATVDSDKTLFSSLFDSESIAKLKNDTEELKTEVTNQIHTIRSEASSMMTVEVPNSVGYESRSLDLTHGTFDVSLSRFSSFFQSLSGAVMLLCSFIAAYIILGSKE